MADNQKYGDDVSYDKIVRDKIPQYLDSVGVDAEYEVSDDGERILLALKKKLVEESTELIEAPKDEVLNEIADVMEILEAIRVREGLSTEALKEKRESKNAERGAYEKGVFLTRAVRRKS
jgi:predicted house-cleaning noncanonical NTP pyrophosphatase (MazG superfamily)